MTLDLSAPRRVHIVGIGGMAMSGIAAVLTRLGHTVSGSDLKAWRGLERLRLLGVDVHVPHDAACLPAELDAVVVSTAIPAAAPGPRLACADDPGASRLAAEVAAAGRPVVTYGEAAGADYRIEGYQPLGAGADRLGSRFDLLRRGERLGEILLPAPGRHNARNAAGAAALATEIGVPFDAVRAALGRFAGVARRSQFHGAAGGVTLVDDYAHLPGEIKATLAAAREGAWRRVVAVFQPHRYTRTARLWRDFGDAFTDADVVVLTDVYAAGEPPQPGVSGRLILQAVCEARPQGRVLYLPKRADVLARLPELTRPGDLVVTLGAGDVTSLPDEWLRSGRGFGGLAPADDRKPVPAA